MFVEVFNAKSQIYFEISPYSLKGLDGVAIYVPYKRWHENHPTYSTVSPLTNCRKYKFEFFNLVY